MLDWVAVISCPNDKTMFGRCHAKVGTELRGGRGVLLANFCQQFFDSGSFCFRSQQIASKMPLSMFDTIAPRRTVCMIASDEYVTVWFTSTIEFTQSQSQSMYRMRDV